MNYGNSWEKFPIEENEIWSYENSKISVNDITKIIPEYMYKADMIYCDSPWSLQNVNMFNNKSGREYINKFSEFYNPLFDFITKIKPNVCFLEIGKQNKEVFKNKLSDIFPIVEEFEITYYKKNICFLLRAASEHNGIDYSGYDDIDTPAMAILNEQPNCVADLCTGRGLTGIAALKNGCNFLGTELNKRKLAVFIDNANKLGYGFSKKI